MGIFSRRSKLSEWLSPQKSPSKRRGAFTSPSFKTFQFTVKSPRSYSFLFFRPEWGIAKDTRPWLSNYRELRGYWERRASLYRMTPAGFNWYWYKKAGPDSEPPCFHDLPITLNIFNAGRDPISKPGQIRPLLPMASPDFEAVSWAADHQSSKGFFDISPSDLMR